MKQGSKRVRFSTSVMFSSSVGLELLTPAFPQYFLLLASVAKSEANHYLRELRRELRREQEEIITVPDTEAAEVAQILADYGMEPHEYRSVVDALRKNPQAWLDFMMKFELGLDNPDPRRALQSAFTIAVSYIIGGLVPLIPYMFIPSAGKAYVFTDTSNWSNHYLLLTVESRVLRDFHVVDVEVPGQYFTDQEVAPDHIVKLDRVGADIPIAPKAWEQFSEIAQRHFIVQTYLTPNARSDERILHLFRVMNQMFN